jgi:hypothetical protein
MYVYKSNIIMGQYVSEDSDYIYYLSASGDTHHIDKKEVCVK